MQKKGYFFMLDAALGLGILLVGAFLIFTAYISEPPKTQAGVLSDDVIDFFSKTKIKELNNEYSGIGGTLWNNGEITNGENTLLQQLGEFYTYNKPEIANKFVENITAAVFVKKYNFEIFINNQLIYPKDPSESHNNSKKSSQVLLSSNRIVYGIANETTGDMWGPYKAEVLTWG